MDLKECLQQAINAHASDVFIIAGLPVSLRKIILFRNLPRKGFCLRIPKISSPIFTSMQATGI